MAECEKALSKREILLKQLVHFENAIQHLQISEEEAHSRIIQLDSIWQKFQDCQDIIENALIETNQDDDDIEAQIAIRTNFENQFHRLKGELTKIAKPKKPESEMQNQPNISYVRKHQKIQLRPFSGKIAEFPAFWDLFNSQVHADENISKVEKLCLLKNSLEGEAFDMVKSLLNVNGNYKTARELLINRYKNKKILVNTYIRNIVYEKHATDSASDLKRIVDCFKNNINGLKQIGEPIENWNSILVFHLTSKFHIKIREEWELKSSPDSIDKLENVFEFLENRIRALTVCDQLGNSKSKFNLKPNPPVRVNTTTIDDPSKPKVNFGKCLFCDGEHANFKCPTILNKPHKAILSTLKKAKACINCMRIGHVTSDCTREKCKKCDEPHHTLLHINKNSSPTANPHFENSLEFNSTVANNASKNTFRANNSVISAFSNSGINPGLLATISLSILDNKGNPHRIRALFDPGAQTSFVTHQLANILKLKLSQEPTPIAGIGGYLSLQSEFRTHFTIVSLVSKFSCKSLLWSKFNAKFKNVVCPLSGQQQ
jgi:hypothetical protein